MSYSSEDKFKLVSYIKKLIIDIEKILENIPRRDFYNRDKFRDEVSDVLYFTYMANNTTDNDMKYHYQVMVLAKLSMIDFYLERAYIFKYISEKQLYNYTSRLEVIIKMTKGWINSNG